MIYEIVNDFSSVKELSKKYNKAAIIWDEILDPKYISEIGNAFKDCIALSANGNDKCKTLETYKMIMSHLVSFNLDRTDLVIGIGGGSILDLAGFTASTYNRGVDLVYIPTTVLSMVDSSIGGKNGLNIDGIKNMIGTFYEPKCTFLNLEFLNTLSERDFKAGVAEIIKIAALSDKKLFDMLKVKPVYDNRNDLDYLEFVINRAYELKLQFVEKDFKDTGIRQALNFGHTFGHAIESQSAFKKLHGEAISIGMIMETELEENPKVLKELKECLKANGLPIATSIDIKDILKDIAYDKKRTGDMIKIPFLSKIGAFKFREYSFNGKEFK